MVVLYGSELIATDQLAAEKDRQKSIPHRQPPPRGGRVVVKADRKADVQRFTSGFFFEWEDFPSIVPASAIFSFRAMDYSLDSASSSSSCILTAAARSVNLFGGPADDAKCNGITTLCAIFQSRVIQVLWDSSACCALAVRGRNDQSGAGPAPPNKGLLRSCPLRS